VKLIVGLGNPGAAYRGTRHNVGFEVADEIARRHDASFASGPGETLMAKVRGLGDGAFVARPLTFMNLSGHAVSELARYYRIELADLLIVADDVNLPLGRLRARMRGTDGGHNGLKSVIEQLGTIEFARLRVGVGRGDRDRGLADHVLARFDPEEKAEIDAAIVRAADAVECFVTDGIERTMNLFNREERDSDPEASEDVSTN
jgi:PTH1 family peptidyl-tRNA hydrolase